MIEAFIAIGIVLVVGGLGYAALAAYAKGMSR